MNSPHIPPKPAAPPKPKEPPAAEADSDNPWLNPQQRRSSESGEPGKASKPKKAKRQRAKHKKTRERKPVNVPKLGWYLFAVTMLGAVFAALALG
ncbi:hypothetical protein HMPREF0183_1360 [Brevibacterium mcbrellneri ATCC 49030]|uniref:Uncharacterized protein n=1 Tax=Brevibacterium mcbrellneri ATCC 49030 TaxID=585530 RepID=D4YN51_9MICO|nr:hypothetical protein [Brevibacterium mcbrellneri]EFG47369.1 hypothetical protein HMPREF0183_1360 [Brevibacterium mcbrellneri ATCC 49030]